jgi:hypothetical protein
MISISTDAARPLRILEIGDELLFKLAAPEKTDFFWTGYRHRGKIAMALGPGAFFRSIRRLRRYEYDLLVMHVPLYRPWHPRVILTLLRDWRLSAPRGLFAVFAWWIIQRFHRTPIVTIDLNGSFGVGSHAFRLIDRSRACFKRELPVDRWQTFFKSGHANLPGLRWRRKRKNIRRMMKLRPISYGSPNAVAPIARPTKIADIFFAGAVDGNSTVRSDGIAELLSLRAEGYIVDIPQEHLDMPEFHRRIACA